jgi:hypothetical protein
MISALELEPKPPCTEMDSELFFSDCRAAEHRKAIAVCNTCPHRQECLEHALQYDYYGIWGGTTMNERKRMQKQLGITPIGLCHLVDLALKPHLEVKVSEQDLHLEEHYNSEGLWGYED